jgi:glutamine synthetase
MAQTPALDIEAIFGENTFGLTEMKNRLPKAVYKSLVGTIERGERIDSDVADAVAMAMKEWAMEKGATHYTHWFQPLTGATAEKHDSFITPNKGGGAVTEFSGKELIQGEPDASSFPSGGLRATFEARGYTAWDPTSPAFIVENPHGSYLAIPTAFASWTGEALDNKIPLLRSMEALSAQAVNALRALGDKDTKKVTSTVGNEQEYFVVDRDLFQQRPDLQLTGRTLFGAAPPRGQEMDDHYFGSIPSRILSFMLAVEKELYRLGIPVKTRHNEVAPSQYEIAPIFEEANVAVDHQLLTMLTLRRFASQFGLTVLMHEKPFRGVNGSGKHNNWSMGTDTGSNLLNPSDDPHENTRFQFFCAAVIRAVYKHQDLLRLAAATAGNDHRLGANEAPPAIMSIFLGSQLSDVFEQLAGKGEATSSKQAGTMHLGADVLPNIPRHSGDRNRTSPFAFTGNKFEFRALGSSQSPSMANTILNTIVAESLEEMTAMLEAKRKGKSKKAITAAVQEVVQEVIQESQAILFDGDGYSADWPVEAEKRGLLNLKTTVDAIEQMDQNGNPDLFAKYDVLTHAEVESRKEIMLEQYFMTINIEAETTERIARTMLFPAGTRYLADLAATLDSGDEVDLEFPGVKETAEELSAVLTDLRATIVALHAQNRELGGDTVESKAYHMRDNVIPAMNAVRDAADRLEVLVPRDEWPLPTYQDILFDKEA